MRRGARITLAIAALFCAGTSSAVTAENASYAWHLPPGFPEPVVPDDNPMSAAKVALGARLFADTRLSVTRRHSCRSCHAAERAFTDGLPRSVGATGETLPLNAPTLLNSVYNASFGWYDTGTHTFEQQMRGPLFNEHPAELGLAGREAVVERELAADAGLAREFAAVFPQEARPVRFRNVIRAIAAYERTLVGGDSPFDRYVFRGEHAALDAAQKRGLRLFFSARSGCAACHGGINFAGPWVDRAQPVAQAIFADTGTGRAVRVPTLRNLGVTAPYMHDGRFASLAAVLDHYEQLAADPAADPRLRRAPLTTGERSELAAFLSALNDAPDRARIP